MFTSFSAWALDFLSKAAGHKYIRRIPYTSGGKLRYRYIYKVTHTAGGKHALHEDDVTVGAAFMLGTDKGSEVHAHVKSVDGDKVTVEYDDGPRKGEKETMSKRDLLSKLDAAHGISAALQGEREKQAKVVADLKARGASEKQIAREQARLERLSVSTPAPEPKSEEPKKRAPKKPKSAERKIAKPAAEAAVAQLPDTNITQRGDTLVQRTTGEYASDEAIPKRLQTALKRFVSKDGSRPEFSEVFRRGEHMYATDRHRAIRVAVQDGPAESGPSQMSMVFNRANDNTPTVTLDARASKGIADMCKALGDVFVEITTMNGKTMFRANGKTFATVDAHTESAPTQYFLARHLADMLSVEHPVTILQDPNAEPTSPLSAHTANTQQILAPIKDQALGIKTTAPTSIKGS